jgi:phosphoglycolate phosphatase-like HAD superfamily hydrolase
VLLLWDIDGTLMTAGRAGHRALERALHATCGIDAGLGDIELAGRTDRWIARRLFQRHGIPQTEEHFAAYLGAYLAALPEELPRTEVHALAGVAELLARLALRGDCTHALLTGNLRQGAETKLRYVGLWSHFRFGAFADDAEERNDLGHHALRRAREAGGRDHAPGQVIVIGDTPHDIECGKVIGARTVAVATGRFRADELAAHSPTRVLRDLTDATAFEAVVSEALAA